MRGILFIVFSILTLLILFTSLQEQDFIMSDLGKDILVAKHLSSGTTDTLFIRPNSTWPELPLTPVYFWLMALLYSIAKSPLGIVISSALIKLVMLFAIFLIGKEMKDEGLGLLFVLLLGTFKHYLYLSPSPFLFVTLFFLLGLYAYIVASNQKKPNVLGLLISIFLIFLSCSIHISAFVMLPSFVLLWIIQAFRFEAKYRILIFIFIFLLLLLLFLLTYFGNVQEFLYSLHGLKRLSQSYGSLLSTRKVILAHFIQNQPMLTILLLPSLIYLIGMKTDINKPLLLILMGNLLLFFLIPFSVDRPLRREYIYIQFLTSILTIGYTMNLLLLHKMRVIRLLAIGIISLFVSVSMYGAFTFQDTHARPHTYEDSEEIAKIIVTDKKYSAQRKLEIILPFYGFGDIPNISKYFSAGIWYSMEQITNKQLATVVDAHNTIQSNNIAHSNTFEYILICIEDGSFTHDSCLADFRLVYPNTPLNPIGTHGRYAIYRSY